MDRECESWLSFFSYTASYKTECPPGTYSNPGWMQCENCDKGYICPMQSTTPAPNGTCPPGGYCDGKQWKPCEAGTYNNITGSPTKDDCHPCPAGTRFYYNTSICNSNFNTLTISVTCLWHLGMKLTTLLVNQMLKFSNIYHIRPF